MIFPAPTLCRVCPRPVLGIHAPRVERCWPLDSTILRFRVPPTTPSMARTRFSLQYCRPTWLDLLHSARSTGGTTALSLHRTPIWSTTTSCLRELTEQFRNRLPGC